MNHLTIVMKPTNECNLRCKYCYHAENGYAQSSMSEDVLEKSMSHIIPYVDSVTYNWHGGEPLLMGTGFYEKAFFYQNKYRKNENQPIGNTMQTNATLLDKDTALFLKKHQVGLGISFDGPYNTQIRGKSDETLKAYDILKSIHKHCGTIIVIGQHNMRDVIPIYQYFKKRNTSFKFSPIFNSGKAKYNTELLISSPTQYAHYICNLFDFWVHDINSNITIRPLSSYIESFFTGRMRSCTKNNCARQMLSIYFDGSLYPCGRSYPKEYCLGTIQSFPHVWDIFDTASFHMFEKNNRIRSEYCQYHCNYFRYCNSGCPNDSLLSGNIQLPNEMQCISHKIILSHVHNQIRNILESKRKVNPMVQKIIDKFSTSSKSNTLPV